VGNLVSVVVPTFNRAYCLRQAVDSALRQSHSELEVLVVDDGSTDDTRDLLASCYGDEPRVRYLYQENRGVSAARNRGIRAAKGEFLAFLDSDDVWKPWKLELQVACLRFLPSAGMVWTDMEAVGPDGLISDAKFLRSMYSAYQWFRNEDLFSQSYRLSDLSPRMGDIVEEGMFYEGDIFSPMIMGNLVHTSTVLIRRERFEKVDGFNEAWISGEDYDYHLRTCREGPVAFIDLASIQYRRGAPDRLSRHRYLVADHFLQTIRTMIRQERRRITLPRKMLHHVLAEAHAWVGEESLQLEDYAGARRHLAKSLGYRPLQPRTMRLLASASLPRTIDRSLRALYRGIKKTAAQGAPVR
jgi:glycosyltransferase involved in cell wall biosynthesis